jgi:hypothetical protein
MQERLNTAWLVAEFFVHSYRISGRLDVRQSRLADQLNDHTTAFLSLEDVYISNIERPADITISYPNSILRKHSITAVVVAREEDGLPRKHTYGSYFGAYLCKVFITTPSFEIKGHLRLSGRLDLRTVLTTGTDDFISVLDGQMLSSVHSDVAFTGGIVLVNKDHIGAFWVAEEV